MAVAEAEVRVTNEISGVELLAWTRFPCSGLADHVQAALRSQRSQAVTALFRGGAAFGPDVQVPDGERVELSAILGEFLPDPPVFRCFCGHPTWDRNPGFCCVDHEVEDRLVALRHMTSGLIGFRDPWVQKCWCGNATAMWPGGEGYRFCCQDHQNIRPEYGDNSRSLLDHPNMCHNPRCADTHGRRNHGFAFDGQPGSYCSKKCLKAHKVWTALEQLREAHDVWTAKHAPH